MHSKIITVDWLNMNWKWYIRIQHIRIVVTVSVQKSKEANEGKRARERKKFAEKKRIILYNRIFISSIRNLQRSIHSYNRSLDFASSSVSSQFFVCRSIKNNNKKQQQPTVKSLNFDKSWKHARRNYKGKRTRTRTQVYTK